VALKTVRLEPQVDRVLVEVAFLERLLVLKEILVHDPEVRLSGRRFGGRRGSPSMRVNVLQREVPEYEPQAIRELALEGMDAVEG
jgi:hypothetical protein